MSNSNNTEMDVSLSSEFKDTSKRKFHATELRNLINNFPLTTDNLLNQDILELKTSLNNYVNAWQVYNLIQQENAMLDIEKYYKRIQSKRKKLQVEENTNLNRYLVRVKMNLNLMESLKNQKF